MLHNKYFPCRGSVLCYSQGKDSQLTTSLQWKAGSHWFFQTLVAMGSWKRVKPGDENRKIFFTNSLKMLFVQKWRKLSSRKNSKHLLFLFHVLGCVLSQMNVCVHVSICTFAQHASCSEHWYPISPTKFYESGGLCWKTTLLIFFWDILISACSSAYAFSKLDWFLLASAV